MTFNRRITLDLSGSNYSARAAEFNRRAHLQSIGASRSDAKAAAARKNGAKGGRPQLPCVTGVTPPGHRRGVCPECRRAAREKK